MRFAKFATVSIGAVALAIGTPAAAQETQDAPDLSAAMTEMGTVIAEMFPDAEPLTPDEEARLPAAAALVEQMIPPGTYAQMMDETMKPMMDGIMSGVGKMPMASMLAAANLDEEQLERVGDATLEDLMRIIDPAYEERNALMGEMTVEMMTRIVGRVEPLFKAGLAKAYATQFSDDELAAIADFFATPVGGRYASKSMLIYADPQVMGVMQQAMPMMFEEIAPMMETMQERMKDLPPLRGPDDLTDAEIARLAEILGIDPAELDLSILRNINET